MGNWFITIFDGRGGQDKGTERGFKVGVVVMQE